MGRGSSVASSDRHVEEQIVENPNVNAVEFQKFQHIVSGPMQAELKCLDKKWRDNSRAYFADTVDEEPPIQINVGTHPASAVACLSG